MHGKYNIILSFILLSLLASCGKSNKETNKAELNDFDRIKEAGELTILTLSSSTTYFMYREEPMGFHYDFAKEFCKEHDLKLNVKLGDNPQQLVQMLESGEGDIIAFSLPIQNELKDNLTYCGVNLVSHQVLVQRAGVKNAVKDVTELIGKEVTVPQNSKYLQRLENLNSELGDGIEINTNVKDSLTTEDLIQMVSDGTIEYTLSDEYIAKLNKTYYRNINIDLAVSFDQRSSWAVAKEATQLAQVLDEWYKSSEAKMEFSTITKKYFELSKQPFSEEFQLTKGLGKGQISPYDNLFKKHAKDTRFDWQLLAAISYQESRFKNGLTSWAGAAGIMGLMPTISTLYGIEPEQRMDPDLSIGVSVKLLQALDKILKDVEQPDERTKFILAAYNGGIGHITDVRALAQKYGDNNQLWDDGVRSWVTKKSQPEYYNDPVCKSGYFRGTETLNYVDEVTRIAARFKKETTAKAQ